LSIEDVGEFLKSIAESIRELFGFDRVSISIMDEERGVFANHVMAGYPPDVEQEIRRSEWAFKTQDIMKDFREDCRVSRNAYFIPAEKQGGSVNGFVGIRDMESALRPRQSSENWHELDLLYFVLLDRAGSVVGYLQADYPRDGRIPPRSTIEGIELFASIAAAGIGNSRTYRRLHDLLEENELKTNRMLRLLEITQSVLRIDDVDIVLKKIADALTMTFNFRKAGVSLFTEGSDRVIVNALSGYTREEDEIVRSSRIVRERVMEDFKEEFRVTRTGYFIPGESQGNGSSFVFIESPGKALQTRKTPESWHELDLLYFALYDRSGKMTGFIQLDYPRDDRIPTKETMEAMEAFASLAAIAIENSAMFSDLNEAKDQVKTYLDLLTHDVGNLVNPVGAYLDMVLTTTKLTPVQYKYLASAQEATRSIMHLVRNMRRSAQMLESEEAQLVPTNLSKSISQSVLEARSAFVGRNVDINVRAPIHDAWVIADNLVDEVTYNLLTNAIKYDEHEDMRIEVDLEPVEFEGRQHWQVRVTDRGVGIPDDLKDKVFSKEFRKLMRVERPVVHKAKGAGIGLSLVKSLVTRYGGKIWVENRVPDDHTQGSVFTFILPSA